MSIFFPTNKKMAETNSIKEENFILFYKDEDEDLKYLNKIWEECSKKVNCQLLCFNISKNKNVNFDIPNETPFIGYILNNKLIKYEGIISLDEIINFILFHKCL
jgi:hypothetical protein